MPISLGDLTPLEPTSDDYTCLWRFKDLKDRQIVSSRTDLSNKQKNLDFPRPVKLTGPGQGNAAGFVVAFVKLLLIERYIQSDTEKVSFRAGPGRPPKDRNSALEAQNDGTSSREAKRNARRLAAKLATGGDA